MSDPHALYVVMGTVVSCLVLWVIAVWVLFPKADGPAPLAARATPPTPAPSSHDDSGAGPSPAA